MINSIREKKAINLLFYYIYKINLPLLFHIWMKTNNNNKKQQKTTINGKTNMIFKGYQ